MARDDTEHEEREVRDRATDALLRAALPEVEPPEGMWARFEVQLAEEEAPALGMLARMRGMIEGLAARQAQAAVAGCCVFLLAYRALWWEGGQLMPMTETNVRWSITDHAFTSTMSEVYHQETEEILEKVTADVEYRWALMDEAFAEFEEHLEGSRDE